MEQQAAYPPLLQLPATAVERVIAHLPFECRKALRSVSRAALVHVDASITEIVFSGFTPQSAEHWHKRFPHATHVHITKDWTFEPDDWWNKSETDITSWSLRGRGGAQFGFGNKLLSHVTTLEIDHVDPAAALVFVRLCPNLESCIVNTLNYGGHRALIPRFFEVWDPSWTKRLSKLHNNMQLSDKGLQDLAVKHTSLTSLATGLDSCSHEGWQALLNMPQLESLDLGMGSAPSSYPASALAGFSQLCTLTALTLGVKEYAHLDEWHHALRLPSSLVHLNIAHLPLPVAKLPHLTSLDLGRSSWQHHMGASPTPALCMATSMPALAQLWVHDLVLTTAWHKGLMPSLTSLEVAASCGAEHGVRLCAIWPNLKHLALCCDCSGLANGLELLEGLTSLESLDANWSGPASMGPAFQPSSREVLALARLPQLTKAMLCTAPATFTSLSALTKLERLILTVDGSCVADEVYYPQLVQAMANNSLPANICGVHVHLDSRKFHGEIYSGGLREPELQQLCNVVDAIILWLASPSHSRITVTWYVMGSDLTGASMTDMRLWTLATSGRVQRLELMVDYHSQGIVHITPQMLQRTQQMMQVVVSFVQPPQ